MRSSQEGVETRSKADRRNTKSRAGRTGDRPNARDLRAAVIARGDPIAYRVHEVLAHLGIGRTKLYDLIGSGKLPAYSHEGVTLIMRADLVAYIADPAKRLPVRAAKAAQ